MKASRFATVAGLLAGLLATLSLMLSDFFDTAGPSPRWAPRPGC